MRKTSMVQKRVEVRLAEAYRGKIIARMQAAGATGASALEVERCLGGCVMGAFLMRADDTLWIVGRLTDQDLKGESL